MEKTQAENMDRVRENSFIEGRESPILPGEKREKEAEGMVGTGGVRWHRERAFLF
jgi:hypothetical protein